MQLDQDSHSQRSDSEMNPYIPCSAIPVPVGFVSSVAVTMGFSRSSKDYQKFAREVRRLVPLYLDTSLRYPYQDPVQVVRLVEKAQLEVPWLKVYHDAWPVRAYLRRHMEKPKCRRCETGRGTMYPCNHRYSHRRPVSGSDAPDNNRPPNINLAVSTSSEITRRTQCTTVAADTASNTPLATYVPEAAPSLCADRPVRPVIEPRPSYHVVHDVTNEVSSFLGSLVPNLDHLAARFVTAGVTDRKCLEGLADLCDVEKDAFLQDDLRLPPFQRRVVRDALARTMARGSALGHSSLNISQQ